MGDSVGVAVGKHAVSATSITTARMFLIFIFTPYGDRDVKAPFLIPLTLALRQLPAVSPRPEGHVRACEKRGGQRARARWKQEAGSHASRLSEFRQSGVIANPSSPAVRKCRPRAAKRGRHPAMPLRAFPH